MDPMDEIRRMFFVECEEHLETLQDGLDRLRDDRDDRETVNAVFRAVHSVKGGAAAFGLADLVTFSHAFETTLDHLRSGRIAVDERILRELPRAADLLARLVAAGRDGGSDGLDQMPAQIARLGALSGPEAEPEATGAEGMGTTERARWRIGFRPFPTLFERGNEPAALLRELALLGETRRLCHAEAIPGLEDFDAETVYLRWTIEIDTEAGREAIAEVFDFVAEDCELTIEPLAPLSPGAGAPLPAPAEPAPDAPRGSAQARGTDGGRGAAEGGTVRVDLERVDRLINLVGELVINQAMLTQLVAGGGLANASPVAVGLDELRHLTREIQESVLAIRAQPVKSLFQRMARIVRETAEATGKTVEFRAEGEMTEVDKTVIERLVDPLTHMIRNAVDHGLEHAERRAEAGKPRAGTVWLSAAHRSGRVLIEIRDDGAGIDRERVRGIAVEKGLITADSPLSDAEIDALLFLPGFSTARTVSDLSGRGVGMDVVKRSIMALGGRIVIQSEPGAGTRFGISLPLTLAILDGMIVSVGGETVVVPLSVVLEMLKPNEARIFPLGTDRVVKVRGEYVPIVDASQELGFPSGIEVGERVIILIETSEGERRALLVDAIQEQRQVVIKGLDAYGKIDGIAAATILGDGRIALILDTDAIVRNAAGRPRPAWASLAFAS